ncbi:MAG: MFS transporter [Pseudonocardia sp.]|nr:MFS transporter [Pseudonocardia sp.]
MSSVLGTTSPADRRAAIATVTGVAVEAYDFIVYSYLVVFLAPVFFPSDDPAAGILASLLVFAAGFVARPLGGVFYGRLGDRIGRRRTLLITIVLMGLATVLMGLLPGYDQIGIAASVLLVALRLLQGFSAGGEVTGAAVYASEHGTSANRGRFNSLQPLGFAIGGVLAPAAVGLTALLVPAGAMAAWGWRIPLLAVLPITLICLLLRTRVEESPQFVRIRAEQRASAAPLRETVGKYPVALLQVIGLTLCNGMINYTIIAYLPVYLNTSGNLSTGAVSWIFAVCSLIVVPFVLFSGALVDRFGQRRVLVIALVLVAILIIPALFVLRNVAAVAAVAAVVLVLLLVTTAIGPAILTASTGLFPTRVRYTGIALGYSIGNVIGGGFGPYLAALLAARLGSPYAPALLFAFAVIVGIVAVLTAKRAPQPEPDLPTVPADDEDRDPPAVSDPMRMETS